MAKRNSTYNLNTLFNFMDNTIVLKEKLQEQFYKNENSKREKQIMALSYSEFKMKEIKQEGKIEVLREMIKDGKSLEDIKYMNRYFKLPEEVIETLFKE
jgi:hypothetical protein